MRATQASAIVVILLLSLIPQAISSEGNEAEPILQGESEEPGPFWILFTCKLESCPGMELSIISDGESFHYSDSHHVEWSGIVKNTVEWELTGSDSLGPEDFVVTSISTDNEGVMEEEDLPDIVPSPGQNSDWLSIDYSSICQLNRCEKTNWEKDKVTFTGSLENSSDEDAILVLGDFGDVVKITDINSRNLVDLEVWHRGEGKTLVRSISSSDFDGLLLDYPQDSELWIRIVHSSLGDFSPYQFNVVSFDGDKEGPDGHELPNPWTYGYQLHVNSTNDNVFRGHISTGDVEGDSILVSSGSKILMQLECEFTGGVSLDIVVHKIGNITRKILENLEGCPEELQTPESTTGVEFNMKSEVLSEWYIEITPHTNGDGSLKGDAPDFLWTETGPSEFWTHLRPGPGSVSGSLGLGDSVDIHPLEINDENGSLVMIRSDIDSPVTYQIQELKQDGWQILNYTNGAMISLPKGNHAIRVEGLSPISGDVSYEFTILYLGENIPDDGEFRDMSHLFTNFYILIGFLMILPLLVVLWWNRSTIIQRGLDSKVNEKHDIERLSKLREKLTKSTIKDKIDPREIESALGKLGETPWEGVLEEWGSPDLRHMTEQIEICAWRPMNDSFLIIGIRAFEKKWSLAGLNLNSPEGSNVEIDGINPSYICEGQDIFLDTIEPHSKKFLRISIGGNPSNIELEISGLVDGEPLAAVPRESLSWYEEK